MANIARLGVVLGLDSAEFQTGLKGAEKSSTDFADKIKTGITAASAVVVGAFGAMVAKSLAYADTMADVAKANDISIGKVLQLSDALTQNGGEADNAGKMLSSLSAAINTAAGGGLAAQQSFAKVGVSLKDLANLSTEQIMQKASDGLAKIGDAATRNALAMDIYGKSAKGVDFAQGGLSDSLSKSTGKFDKHANAIEIAGNFNDILAKKTNDLTLAFVSGLFPALQDINDAFTITGTKETDAIDATKILDTVVRTLAVTIAETYYAFSNLGLAAGQYVGYVKILATEGYAAAEEYRARETARGELQLHDHQVMLDKMLGLDKEYQMSKLEGTWTSGTPIKPTLPKLRDVTEAPDPKKKQKEAEALQLAKEAQAIKEELRLVSDISNAYDAQLNKVYEKANQQGLMLAMTADEKQMMQAMSAIDDQRSAKLDEIQKKLDKEKGKDKRIDKTYSDEVIAELERQKIAVGEVADKYKQLSADQIISQQAAQKTFAFGWDKSFKQYAEDSRNYAKLGEQAFTSVTGNMTAAIDTFVKTGKINFKDLAGSIIRDLISIQLKMQAMDLFKSIGGGMGGLLGGLFGGTAGAVAGGVSSSAGASISGGALNGGYAMAANGGTIDSPTIVGERGPELFVPGRSGAVIPTNDMSALSGGNSGPVYNGPYIANMSAIDTQSAAQFLSNNKMTIFAANQSAARSMPMSR